MKFDFIGWNNSGKHDKVWVCIPLGDRFLAAYGRRGKKLQTKIYTYSQWDMTKLITQKLNRRGYIHVDETKLSEVYPEFESDLEATAMWATLGLEY